MSTLKVTYGGREIYTSSAAEPVYVWYNSGGGGPRAQLYEGDTKTLNCSGKVCTDNIRITDFNYYVNNTLNCKNKYMSSNVVMSLMQEIISFRIGIPAAATTTYITVTVPKGYTFARWISEGTDPFSYSFSIVGSTLLPGMLLQYTPWEITKVFIMDSTMTNYIYASDVIQNGATYEVSSVPIFKITYSGIAEYGFEKSTTPPCPSGHDGVYRSTNWHVDASWAVMKVEFEHNYTFNTHIRSYAEGNWDYIMASTLDAREPPVVYTSELVKAHTRGHQRPGDDIASYTAVDYSNDGEYHYIYFTYIKDSSTSSNDDRGYVLLPTLVGTKSGITFSIASYGGPSRKFVVDEGTTWRQLITSGQYPGNMLSIRVMSGLSLVQDSETSGLWVNNPNDGYTVKADDEIESLDYAVGSGYWCLTGDTLVTMADRTEKRIDEIEIGDEILSFDWKTKSLVANKVIETDKDEDKSFTEYDIWTFDDGSIVKTVHRHEFYNVEAGKFKYMDEWKIGEHIYKIDGTKPALVNHEVVKETVKHYKITGENGTNFFANGLLTGDRNCPENINL